MSESKLKDFAINLFKINAIKFGEFKTKVGLMTPVYCDLRVIVSHPKILNTLSELITDYLKKLQAFDIICGVPYTALPIATAVSLQTNIPMVMRRKEAKDYGTKKLIEGTFRDGDKCLIIEDVVTSGSSILETVSDLKGSGIQCADAIVLLNREQGGENLLRTNGIQMHALLSLTQLMQFLQEANCIDNKTVDKVGAYLKDTQVDSNIFQKDNRLKLTFEDRKKFVKNEIGKELLEIICKKKSTLCVAADLTTTTAILNLAEQVGPYICVLKTHIDVIEDFHPNFLTHLKEIANRHNFILFEDRKFADIGKTVQLQYSESIYKISSWAPIVTCHAVMGKGTLDALKTSPGLENKGVFLLAEASSVGSLIDNNYVQGTLKMLKEYPEIITGLVCQSPLFLNEPGYIQLTPGCHLESVGDHLSQQYNTPDVVVLNKGADVIVVGRGITKSPNPDLEAEIYRKLLWEAYEKRIK